MASTNLEVVISARDKFTGTANRVIGTLGKMDSAAGRVGKGFTQLGAGMARVATVGAVAAGGALVGIAKATIEWESALAGVNKTMDLTPRELEAMGTGIRKLATAIPVSANEIAGLVEQAGALGIAKNDVLDFAKTAAIIGVTTDVSADQAATSLGVMSNLLGLSGQEFERFASSLVDLGNKGASTEAQIIAIAERAAGAGATIGLAADDVLGWASAVANIGIEPEAGGSSLQRFFLETMKAVSEGDEKLKTYGKTAGMSGKEFKAAFGKDASGALETFIDGLAKLNKEQRLKVLEDLDFNDIRITRMLLGLAEAESQNDNVTKSLNVSAAAWKSNTAAAEEADKRFGTVASKLTLLRNQVTEGALLVGEGFLPALGRVADKLKGVLADPKARNDLKQFGRDIGAFIDSINWTDVLAGAKTFVSLLKDAASWAGTIIGTFNKLPAEVKAAAVGFLAVNKLSGGLIGQGVGNIVGGLGETAIRGIGATLPGVGRVFAQPVFVTNWPAGGLLPGGGGGGAKVPPVAPGIITPMIGAGIAIPDLSQDPRTRALIDSITKPGRVAGGSFGSNIPTTSRLAPEDRAALLASNKQRAAEFQSSQLAAHRDREHNTGVLRQVSTAASAVSSSVRGVTSGISSAIRANRPVVDVDVNVNVTERQVRQSTTTQTRYGPSTGSRSRTPGRTAL